ncbi:AEC family transporter [Azoarcus sp. L1K30]|uniref:AEC family transporter n=1 Tax=Azoarcus sp. L1K30 TaxID=2820277 RepID=UPI001B845D92|nr:AEC family transporter [Azoarcus sp. L1K30]MBR0567579.1 AEC family transporter [Azoarcus sp. L1K30]
MSGFLEVVDFSFVVTGPIFVILALGVVLRRTGLITDGFIEGGSKLVFTVGLPALLFLSISKTQGVDSAPFDMIGFGLLATFLLYLALEKVAKHVVEPARDRGVVVQGAFRSNFGVIGLAYCANAYGEAGLATASLYLGLITILVNVLGVITLSRALDKPQGLGQMVRGVATNPLIIGIVLALPVSWLGISLPRIVLQSGRYFADMTLPVALLCTGASLNFRSLRQELGNTLLAIAGKLVVMPLVLSVGAVLCGFRGIELGTLMLMASAPSAAAGYVMVRAMGGNAALAANIIALTTLGSIVTTSIGIMVLKGVGWM